MLFCIGLNALIKAETTQNLPDVGSKLCESGSSPSILHQHVWESCEVQVHCLCLSVVQESISGTTERTCHKRTL